MFHTLNKPKEDMLIQGDYMFADSGENFRGIGTPRRMSNDVVVTLDGEHMFQGVTPVIKSNTVPMIEGGSDIIVNDPYLAKDCPNMIFVLQGDGENYESTEIYKYCKANNMSLFADGDYVCGRDRSEIYPDATYLIGNICSNCGNEVEGTCWTCWCKNCGNRTYKCTCE